MSRKTVLDFTVLIGALLIGGWGLANQQEIKDWWLLRGYEPPAEIAALADGAKMSDDGRRLFYAGQPELNGRDSFNENCQFPEKSLVLGCFSDGRIYVFKVDSNELEGVEEVTAAHEMLHSVYSRLSSKDRERIDSLIQAAYANLNDQRIRELVESYEKDDPGSVNNELHSILGTEVSELPDELEAHYNKYLSDRGHIVALTKSYEGVFLTLDEKITSLNMQIAALKTKIKNSEANLTQLHEQLESELNQLDSLRNQGSIDAYNAAVPIYNQHVKEFNIAIAEYEELVSKHNKLVKEHNSLVNEQNQLLESLDSKFEASN